MVSGNPEPPIVSIVIPTFNRPECLRRAIASVQKQKEVSFEIIIVDDGSEIDLSEEYSNQTNIQYIRNETNRGGGYARNKGLALARGTFVNFLDDDDIFLDGKLEAQIRQFSESDVLNLGMVSCHIRDLRSGKEVISENRYKGDIYLESLKEYTVKLTSTMLFLTDAVRSIGGFDIQLPANQEYDLIIRLSKKYQVDYVDQILAEANMSEQQISHNFDKKITGARLLFKKFDSDYRNVGFFFWLRMQCKLRFLLFRFFIGKYVGFKAYRFLLCNKSV
ncbi:glycosyltransferase family 2 protein [Balneolaceae bacterium ANBcel3]|nr:glycosyltransferase family 2 protein [Balneolaceae bacterium ANBcel3]